MPAYEFSKWSPGGNTTIFLPHEAQCDMGSLAALASEALSAEMLGGEQAGFVDISRKTLLMAGGEFCCNASRAFGALLALRDNARQGAYSINVSGWPTPVSVEVSGLAPSYTVDALLDLPTNICVETVGKGLALVRLPGIVHVLLDKTLHPAPELTVEAGALAIQDICQRFALHEAPCVGGIWWHEKGAHLGMLPVVFVRAINTTFFESACGSGALALALWLAGRDGADTSLTIGQPSGTPLQVTLDRQKRRARVSGPVTLLAQGQVWLDSA